MKPRKPRPLSWYHEKLYVDGVIKIKKSVYYDTRHIPNPQARRLYKWLERAVKYLEYKKK